MKKPILLLIAVALSFLTGCASVKMQETALVNSPKEKMAIVNFVRPAIFFGDGVNFDLWDGKNYIGSIGAGKLIQYEVEPGQHLFLASAENWSYASAELQAGKQYFIKANTFPGVVYGRVSLQVVQPDDQRVQQWLRNLTPTVASAMERKEIANKKQKDIEAAVAAFESGMVTSFAKVRLEHGR